MPADPLPPLTADEWQQLQALFAEACDLSAEDRGVFVTRAQVSHAIRTHLAGMLAADPHAVDRLERVVTGAARTAVATDLWPGRQFGAYRVVREIGRGGMGIVLEAVRDDVEKRVAVKIAPWAHDVAAIRERFRLEGRILAALEHPHIARFLDAGTEGDVPYVVMEFVEGRSIAEYCAQERLDLRRRLELFRTVCGAVHFAHEHLVVHRDLKPANIMVDREGAPRLLDFGIAKLLEPGSSGDLTRGAAMSTPDYSSPEQIRNGPVSVRTDVYSLGLILYELLTDARAQIADSSSASALDRSVCEIDPPPPSLRVAASGERARARRLRGDLDTIVMKAINKEPERRYASAEALGADVDRHLAGHPVVGRPSSGFYKAAKFVRRHRVGVAAALLVAASAAGGVAATIYQARRAERRFDQVRSLANAIVFDVHDRIAQLPGSTEARQALVRTALTYLENLKDDASGDATLAAELAAAYERIGNVQGNPLSPNLGDMRGAVTSFRRAEDLLAPIAGGDNVEARFRLASVLHGRGLVHRALGDVSAADDAYDRARRIGEELLARQADHRGALTLMGSVYGDISQAARDQRAFAASSDAAQRAVETAKRLVDLNPQDRSYRASLASAYSSLGGLAATAARMEEAAANYRLAIGLREQLMREDPATLTYRRNLIVGYGNLGDVLGARIGQNLGDVRGAETALARATELAEWVSQRDPADRRALFDLANVKLRYGTLLSTDGGRAADGLQQLEAAAQLNARLLAEEPTSNRYQFFGLTLDRRIGNALASLGRGREAARVFERLRASGASLVDGPNGPSVRLQMTLAGVSLAFLRAEAGDPRAPRLAEAASTEMQQLPSDVPLANAEAWATLGRTYVTLAQREPAPSRPDLLAQATAHFDNSIAIWRQAKLPAQLEPRRVEALATLAAERAAVLGGAPLTAPG
jgi:tetratricopeptide (TPR) repeat protein